MRDGIGEHYTRREWDIMKKKKVSKKVSKKVEKVSNEITRGDYKDKGIVPAFGDVSAKPAFGDETNKPQFGV